MLSVCSIDPASCWSTGEPIELDARGRAKSSASGTSTATASTSAPGWSPTATAASAATCPVWRFLPGTTPGSYVDCAVSACSLRVYRRRRRLARRPPPSPSLPGGAAPQPAGRRGRPHPATSSRATRSWCAAPASIRARYFYVDAVRRAGRTTRDSVVVVLGDGGDEHDRGRRRLRRPVRGARSWSTWARWRTARPPPSAPRRDCAGARPRRSTATRRATASSSCARSGSSPTRTGMAVGPPQFPAGARAGHLPRVGRTPA